MKQITQSLMIVVWLCAVIAGQTGNTTSPEILEIGRQATRGFKSGEFHSYKVMLSTGEAVRIIVEQRGVDVIATSYRTDGRRLKHVDSPNGANGPEHLLFVAESTGAYRVEITSFDTMGAAGQYDIKLDSVLTAEQFRQLSAVEQKAFTDIPRPFTASDEQRMRQNELVASLQSNGMKYEGRRAVVIAERGLLTQQELTEFGTLVDKGVDDVERCLQMKFDEVHYGDKRMHYFISNMLKDSSSYFSGWESRQPFIFLEGLRVKAKTDPYLHETAHAILGETGSSWLAEGLANYVSSYVSEHVGGHDHKVFSNRGNAEVDQHVRALLASEHNASLLKKIFTELNYFDFSEFANEDEIQEFRAVAYPVSHSFVKFLVAKAGLKKVKKIYVRKDTDSAIAEILGRNKDWYITTWFKHLHLRTSDRNLTEGSELDNFTTIKTN